MEHDIGHMQVHIRLYKNEKLYDSFALNGLDELHCVSTELCHAEFKIVTLPENKQTKALQLVIKISEDDSSIAMLIPVHQSSDWEMIKPMEQYTVGFYCIQGDPKR